MDKFMKEIQEINRRGTAKAVQQMFASEDLLILAEANFFVKKEFSKKLPEKDYKLHKKNGEETIEIIGALVNKPEEYTKELTINGKKRKFKFILKKEEPPKKKTFEDKMIDSMMKKLEKEEKKKSKPSFFTKISKFLNFD